MMAVKMMVCFEVLNEQCTDFPYTLNDVQRG